MASTAPPVTFSTFVISLAHSALAPLGKPDPADAGHGAPVDRSLAEHTLALMDVLAEKTKGNLEPDEDRLLQAVRSEIRGKLG